MADARQRHKEQLQAARDEYHRLQGDTPHRRDLLRHIRRLEKELKTYDYYRSQRG